jgi:hypothetical protein
MLIFAMGIGFIAGFIVVAGVRRVLEIGLRQNKFLLKNH